LNKPEATSSLLEWSMDHELQALLTLLRATAEHPTGTPERRRQVAELAGVSADNLYQVARGILLASGRPRRLGRDVKERLDAAFPGWLDLNDRPVTSTLDLPTGTSAQVPLVRWPHERFPQIWWANLTLAERAVVEEAMLDAYDRVMARRDRIASAASQTGRSAA
jgi:hypothetical protein